ncbi:MAG: O-antigen ligase family protein [Terriglobales bacterium]
MEPITSDIAYLDSHEPARALVGVDAGETTVEERQPLGAAYFWLLLFFVVYCARPEDWVPGLGIVPLAKIAGVFCGLSFVASIPQLRRHLPRETIYLALLVFQLWLTVPLSPVWRGGAFYTTLDFSKVLLIVLVMGVAVITLTRLRRLIFVQTASVAVIAAVTVLRKGLVMGRLVGAVHGIYENSNELALILVLTLPFCVAFLLRTSSLWRKAVWATAAMLLVYGTMLTGSRAGLLALLVSGAVCLREFGIRGRRIGLVLGAAGAAMVLMLFARDTVMDRFHAMFNDEPTTTEGRAAYASAVERQELFWKALAVTANHPLFGIGPGNFNSISGHWKDQHNTYTQMSSEGGVPALILYLLLLWCALANLRKTNRLATPDSEEALFAMALRGSVYGLIVGSFFATSAYHFFPYFLVGYTSALVVIVETKQETAAAGEVQEEIHGEYEESLLAG